MGCHVVPVSLMACSNGCLGMVMDFLCCFQRLFEGVWPVASRATRIAWPGACTAWPLARDLRGRLRNGAPRRCQGGGVGLLTKRNAKTLDDRVEPIAWYLCRSGSKTFFHVLKSVCHVEALQTGSASETELAPAVRTIVSSRYARSIRRRRTHPHRDATFIFTDEE